MAEEERHGEGFLSRWSRLKQGRREESEAELRPVPPAPATDPVAALPLPKSLPDVLPETTPAPEPEPETEPEFDLASLPRLEDLTAGSDLAVFLRKGVPAALRNAALRRVWSLDPGIRDFIGPADYAWDWNVPGGAPGYAETIAHGPDVDALADRILGIGREPPAGQAEPREDVAEAAPEPVAVRREADGPLEPPAPAALTEAHSVEGDLAAAQPVPGRAPVPTLAPTLDPAPARPRHGGAVPG